jgi:hypothetical protein
MVDYFALGVIAYEFMLGRVILIFFKILRGLIMEEIDKKSESK